MGRFIDEKGRIGGKLSVIDLAILLIVIMIAVGAVIKFTVTPQTSVMVEVVPVRYTLQLANVRDWATHNIREGDTVFSMGSNVGTVVSVTSEPYRFLVQGNGVAWWGEVPDRYWVFVEIEATATVTDGRFLVSRTVPMGVGNSQNPFTTRYAQFHAVVREIGQYGT